MNRKQYYGSKQKPDWVTQFLLICTALLSSLNVKHRWWIQAFKEEGAPNPKVRPLTSHLAQIFWKTARKIKQFGPKKGGACQPSLDLPMSSVVQFFPISRDKTSSISVECKPPACREYGPYKIWRDVDMLLCPWCDLHLDVWPWPY